MSLGRRVALSRCMVRRLADWRVSRAYCSVAHRSASKASLVSLYGPCWNRSHLTTLAKGAKGITGLIFRCSFLISRRAGSLLLDIGFASDLGFLGGGGHFGVFQTGTLFSNGWLFWRGNSVLYNHSSYLDRRGDRAEGLIGDSDTGH